ncbi:MAG: TerB N-terminal domain-containing protein [Candidatus Paceibacterota bacterium]
MFQFLNKYKSVPEFNEYYPTLEGANPDQRNYYQWFLNELGKGNTPDIEGNLSYIFIFLYDTINRFIKDRDYRKLSYKFDLINLYLEEYEKLNSYVHLWRSDAALLVENWKEVWEHRRNDKIDTTILYQCISNEPSIRIIAKDLYSLIGNNPGLTNFGSDNINEVNNVANRILSKIQESEGRNFLRSYLDKYNWDALNEEDMMQIADDCEYLYSIRKFKNALKKVSKSQSTITYTLFPSIVTEMETQIETYSSDGVNIEMDISTRADRPKKSITSVNPIIDLVLIAKCKLLLRESENLLREEKGLPRIGEGWISETQLYQEIKNHFKDTAVVQHARPEWLKPQHLDVFLPIHKIAIEFQGAQHIRPVDYFGGEKAFKQQKKRDERKAKLCQENHCHLIEVYQGYNKTEVLKKISKAIDESDQQPNKAN